MARYNYFQPVYFEYDQALNKNITGYVMEFPGIAEFKKNYGKQEEKAPTQSLLDTIRLLIPQIRVINNLFFNGEPNPAAFLASKEVEGKYLSLIFNKWIEIWYPESKQEKLKSLCTADKFNWEKATPEQLQWWSPAWAVATELSKHEYKLGEETFKLLFAPGRKENTVELVSWPPFSTPKEYKSSLGVVISTQSDLNHRRINIHFKMKRWVVKRGEKVEINLQAKTTHCHVLRYTPWSGEDNLPAPDPNAFITLEAKNFKTGDNKFERRWKDKNVIKLLEKLYVKLPKIEDVLQEPQNFINTNKTDILIPARSWQKAGWGTGFTISDGRKLLKQMVDILPPGITLTKPWKKIDSIKGIYNNQEVIQNIKVTKATVKSNFSQYPKIQKPSQGKLPKLKEELKEFLKERANNQTLHVFTIHSNTKEAIEKVAHHYFGDSLKLNFVSSNSLADQITFKESKKKNSESKPELKHIKDFGKKHKQEKPSPIIVEIFPPDHPSYNGDADPKKYIKSELPKYNLIPQCIVSLEKGIDTETNKIKIDEDLNKNLYNRAFSAILDALMPFDSQYPLSTAEDNNAYAGFYLISRNNITSGEAFHEPALVVIYKNEIKVLLPAQDANLRSFPEAIYYLSKNPKNKTVKDQQVINTMLNQLSTEYSNADEIYLYVHAQNVRTYWQWLQDGKFDKNNPPTKKITIMRIRDLMNNEVVQGYGLETEKEYFTTESASFAQGIFIAQDFDFSDVKFTKTFTQTVLSVAQKPQTLKQPKSRSRFEAWTSEGYEKEEIDGKKVDKKILKPENVSKLMLLTTLLNPKIGKNLNPAHTIY